MKTYPSDTVITVPVDWAEAAGCQHGHNQCHVLIIAPDKAGARALLADRTRGSGDRIAAECKLRRPPLSNHEQALVDLGIVRLGEPGVYVYRHAVKDSPVIRVNHGGTVETVAHFRYERGGCPGDRLTVEKQEN